MVYDGFLEEISLIRRAGLICYHARHLLKARTVE